jgi:hypothetical protein
MEERQSSMCIFKAQQCKASIIFNSRVNSLKPLLIVISQSLEVSKIKKNKKNFEKFWSSIINKGSYEMRFYAPTCKQ